MAKRPTKVAFGPDDEDLAVSNGKGLTEGLLAEFKDEAVRLEAEQKRQVDAALYPGTPSENREAGERAFPSYKDGLPIPGTPSRNQDPAFADLDVVAYHPVEELKKLRE